MSKKTSEQAARELVDSFNREVAGGGSGEKTKELAREIGGEETRETERRAKSRRRRTRVRSPAPKAEPQSETKKIEVVIDSKRGGVRDDITPEQARKANFERELLLSRQERQVENIQEGIRKKGVDKGSAQRLAEAEYARQRISEGDYGRDLFPGEKEAVRDAGADFYGRRKNFEDTSKLVVTSLQASADRSGAPLGFSVEGPGSFSVTKFEKPVSSNMGDISVDTSRSRITKLRSDRARLEAQGTFLGNLRSGRLALGEVIYETGQGASSLVKGTTTGAFEGFETKSAGFGFFPSPVPKQDLNVPSLSDIGDAAYGIGPELQRDPIKGGVLIAAEIASGPVPIAGLRGQRLAASVSKTSKITPTPLTVNIPSTGKTFTIVDDVARTGGQIDLTGRLAKTDNVFRPTDFIPIQEGGKLKWIPPNDPRLRTETFTNLETSTKSNLVTGRNIRDVYSGKLDQFGQPTNIPSSAKGVSVASPVSKQKFLTDPKVSGVGDPVFVTDKFTGRTSTVEALVLPDFLASQPNRFTNVRRPGPGKVNINQRFTRVDGRQSRFSFDDATNTKFVVDKKPRPLSSDIPSTDKPFKVADSVGTTVMQLDKRSGSGSIVSTGGQLDLGGDVAKTPSSVFKRGDFVPVQLKEGERLTFLRPDDPRLRSEAFSPLKSPSQNILVDPKVSGVGDPVFVTDKFTGRTTTVDASALPDFLSESPGRFTDVRRPTPTGLTMDQRFKTLDSRQTQLSPDSPSQPFFASLFPIPPIERFSGSGGLSSVGKSVVDVKDVGKTSFSFDPKVSGVGVSKSVVDVKDVGKTSFISGTSSLNVDKSISTPLIGVSTLGTKKVSDLKPVSATLSVTNIDVASSSRVDSERLTSTASSLTNVSDIDNKFASVSKSATRSNLVTSPKLDTSLRSSTKSSLRSRTIPSLAQFSPVTPSVPIKMTPGKPPSTPTGRPPKRPPFRPTGFPGLDINRQRRTTFKTSFETSRTPSLRSIRTAGAGRDFIISPGRTKAGKVVELRKGVKGKTSKKKKKDELGFSTSTSISFRGLGL